MTAFLIRFNEEGSYYVGDDAAGARFGPFGDARAFDVLTDALALADDLAVELAGVPGAAPEVEKVIA